MTTNDRIKATLDLYSAEVKAVGALSTLVQNHAPEEAILLAVEVVKEGQALKKEWVQRLDDFP